MSYEFYYKIKVPKGVLVCHHCDVRLCFNPYHLFLGSFKDNSQDALSKGRHYSYPRGKLHPLAKLSKKKARKIKKLYNTGNYTQQKLAERFNCSQVNISAIITGKSYSYLKAA